jgi:hypothetical protein
VGQFLLLLQIFLLLLPLAVVIVVTGGVTPTAIAAEMLETIFVLPVNIFGIYLINEGIKVKESKR